MPDAESHAAYTFCGVGTLAILGDLDLVDKEELGLWMSQRQTLLGGFNGRPGQLPDICYSWWLLSSMFMIEKQEWIDFAQL